jgi:hypothetical protein
VKIKEDETLGVNIFRVDIVFEDQVLTSFSFKISKIRQGRYIIPTRSTLTKVGLPAIRDDHSKLNEQVSKMTNFIKKILDFTSKEEYCLFSVDLSPLEIVADDLENNTAKLRLLLIDIKDKINNYFCHALYVLNKYNTEVKARAIELIKSKSVNSEKIDEEFYDKLIEAMSYPFLSVVYKRNTNADFIELMKSKQKELLISLAKDDQQNRRIINDMYFYLSSFFLELYNSSKRVRNYKGGPRYYYDIHSLDNQNRKCRCAFVININKRFFEYRLINSPIKKDESVVSVDILKDYIRTESVISKGSIISSLSIIDRHDGRSDFNANKINERLKKAQLSTFTKDNIIKMLFLS